MLYDSACEENSTAMRFESSIVMNAPAEKVWALIDRQFQPRLPRQQKRGSRNRSSMLKTFAGVGISSISSNTGVMVLL